MNNNLDDAHENYLELKAAKEAKKLDAGTDRRKKSVSESNKLKRSAKYSLGAHNLVFKDEEREIWKTHYDDIKEEIEATLGEFKASHKLALNLLCYGVIRVYRKSRLEAHFGRFFDRMAPHDPVTQVLAILSKLGLLSDKPKEGGTKTLLGKMMSDEAGDLNNETSGKINYDDWVASKLQGQELPEVQFRTPKVLPRYDDDADFAATQEEETTSS